MTVRHAPLFVLALPLVMCGLVLAGAPAVTLLFALMFAAVPVLGLLLLPADRPRRPRIIEETSW
ncbi:hypothetical protein [Nocardia huaxiensis]|uniref:Uncharacterized protein n=1 Tax=Nocardia huaxiensis TaxID=2755382 RepID=A0A7D6ZFC6_9NOCA|nr:hypothetical protein [Nocardia huaxiensis]QLY28600.1 hypothetical protein H0264_25070 [Nocardia huaxiensis]UFS97929.1 hypothetical protein LPY97_08525 [Nocardia huaxiensis]